MNQWFSSLNRLTTLPQIRQMYRVPVVRGKIEPFLLPVGQIGPERSYISCLFQILPGRLLLSLSCYLRTMFRWSFPPCCYNPDGTIRWASYMKLRPRSSARGQITCTIIITGMPNRNNGFIVLWRKTIMPRYAPTEPSAAAITGFRTFSSLQSQSRGKTSMMISVFNAKSCTFGTSFDSCGSGMR